MLVITKPNQCLRSKEKLKAETEGQKIAAQDKSLPSNFTLKEFSVKNDSSPLYM